MTTTCYAIEYFDQPLSQVLERMSPSWILIDPFRVYWAVDAAGNEDGVKYLDRLDVVDEGHSWLNSVLLLEASTAVMDLIREIPAAETAGRPDWALRYDYFLEAWRALQECSEIVISPGLWIPDAPGGNAVALCRSSKWMLSISQNSVITPIDPAAILRAWPSKMFQYVDQGIGLTGRKLNEGSDQDKVNRPGNPGGSLV